MAILICHKKLTVGNNNICTLTLGTMFKKGVLFLGCPIEESDNNGSNFLVNCSHYRSMNKRQ